MVVKGNGINDLLWMEQFFFCVGADVCLFAYALVLNVAYALSRLQ